MKEIKKILKDENLVFEGIAKLPADHVCISDPKTGSAEFPHGSTVHIKVSEFSPEILQERISELRKQFKVEK